MAPIISKAWDTFSQGMRGVYLAVDLVSLGLATGRSLWSNRKEFSFSSILHALLEGLGFFILASVLVFVWCVLAAPSAIREDILRKNNSIKDATIKTEIENKKHIEGQIRLLVGALEKNERLQNKANHSISSEKIPLFINGIRTTNVIPLNTSSSQIDVNITIHNESDVSLQKFRVEFLVLNCKVESTSIQWVPNAPDERFSGIIFYAPEPEEDLEPGESANLPGMKLSCKPGMAETYGMMRVYAKDMKRIEEPFMVHAQAS